MKIATGEIEELGETDDGKSKAAVELAERVAVPEPMRSQRKSGERLHNERRRCAGQSSAKSG